MTVDYDKPLQGDYLPATLTAKDYPNLIAEGEQVDTIAVPAVLAAYNWAPNTDRYRKLAHVRGCFLHEIPAPSRIRPSIRNGRRSRCRRRLPDWQRLPAAQQWLDTHGIEPVARDRFDEFLKQSPAAAKLPADADKEALFKQFQAWEAEQERHARRRRSDRDNSNGQR